MAIVYKLDLIDILHVDKAIGVFDVESRADQAAIEVLPNGSLEIRYLNRPGTRTTSEIIGVFYNCPVQPNLTGVYVETRNSVYCFHASEGKYDDLEVVERLQEDIETMRGLRGALHAFFEAFA